MDKEPHQSLLWCFPGSCGRCTVAHAQSVTSPSLADPPSSIASAPQRQPNRILVPNHPAAGLFAGEQGKQKTEVSFNPTTQIVTIKMLVQDPNGYFIPNIRRDNFAVYEGGVHQHNATVEIENAPISVAVLMERSLIIAVNPS